MDYLELFDAHSQRRELADTTREVYRYQTRAWLSWCQARNIEPLAASRRDVESHRDELKARNLSEAARSLRVIVIRGFYESLVDAELLSVNPALRVQSRRTRRAHHKALSQQQLQTLFSSLENANARGHHSETERQRDTLLIALMALHGLRRIETHRLSWADFEENGAAHLRVTGKGGHVRSVYLRPDTLQMLLEYRARLARENLLESGAVFVCLRRINRGKRLSLEAISALVERRLGAACLREKGISCHALRHTFGTLAIAGGAGLEHVRDAMGHSNIATTSIYIRAVERIENNPALCIVL